MIINVGIGCVPTFSYVFLKIISAVLFFRLSDGKLLSDKPKGATR